MLLNTTEKSAKRVRNAEKVYNSEMVRNTTKDKCTAASKASSYFSSEEYRQSVRIKRVAFRLVPPYGGLLVRGHGGNYLINRATLESTFSISVVLQYCENVALSNADLN